MFLPLTCLRGMLPQGGVGGNGYEVRAIPGEANEWERHNGEKGTSHPSPFTQKASQHCWQCSLVPTVEQILFTCCVETRGSLGKAMHPQSHDFRDRKPIKKCFLVSLKVTEMHDGKFLRSHQLFFLPILSQPSPCMCCHTKIGGLHPTRLKK